MAERSFAPGEIAVRGEAIYRERIHKLVAPVERGCFVVIDVETSDYQVDASDVIATRRLLDRCPSAMTYAVRVGHLAAYSHSEGSGRPEVSKSESEDRQALVTLEIMDAKGHPYPVDVGLDTGFTGCLILPTQTVRHLGLPSVGLRTLELGSGDFSELEAYLTTVSLQGDLNEVLVLKSDSAPLVGMSLLWRSRIVLHTIPEAEPDIQRLQSGLSTNKFNASTVNRLLDSLWRSIRTSLSGVTFVAAAVAMIVAVAFGTISLPLSFGEILTFIGIWLALGVLLGQNKPSSMPLRQYLARRGVAFLCCYVFFLLIVIAYVARDEDASQVVTGDEFWGLLVLSLVSFAAGFFAGQDKEKKR